MERDMTVGELEELLFAVFRREDAESWDQPGLQVGDRSAALGRVAFNLDASLQAVIEASEHGCNVLVTHHPAFIKDGPCEFAPADDAHATAPGRMIYEAARRGVSVISMHTNADRARAVRERYASLLRGTCLGNFEHLTDAARSAKGTGFGALLTFRHEAAFSLETLAERCDEAFGGAPRVWGERSRHIERVVVLNGSWALDEVRGALLAAGVDAVIVGETRYHCCVDAQPQLCVIELGHDRSELPIVDVLETVVREGGVDASRCVRLACSGANWWTPHERVGHV